VYVAEPGVDAAEQAMNSADGARLLTVGTVDTRAMTCCSLR
jgi:hypothetical protein